MIEKIKVIYIVSTEGRKTELLDSLRNLGVVHFSEKKMPNKELSDRFNALNKTLFALSEFSSGETADKILSDSEFKELYQKALDALESKKKLTSLLGIAVTDLEKIRAYGDFVPSDIENLKKSGVDFHFYNLSKKDLSKLKEDIQFIHLSRVNNMELIATIGSLSDSYSQSEFVIPQKGVSQLEEEIASYKIQIQECDNILKESSKYIPSFKDQILNLQNDMEYSSVSNTMTDTDNLVWIRGYIPESDIEKFKKQAEKQNWAYIVEDPKPDDEKIPTKVKYNKITRLMIPIFDILGVVPGYHEYDISFWFLGFFTLFFAMIIGDAGYGFLFLTLAVVLNIKNKCINNTILLLYVLSIATIICGSITGTWFGLESAMNVPLLKKLVIPNFANYPEYFGLSSTSNQNSIMKFCFIIGTIQLTLACVMNVKRKLKEKNLSLVADLGWLLSICALYFVVLYLVIGEQINLVPVVIVVISGFLLVVTFGGMEPGKSFSQGLKAGLGNAFTIFLNTISAFGNIMSYIRLFAVGMASLAIAQSFNNMASGFSGPLLIVGAVIMLIGHALNVVMGLLSVVVHGVRLNLLEFSGQLGMEWSGIKYNPFKKIEK